jgi:hypothetical protein
MSVLEQRQSEFRNRPHAELIECPIRPGARTLGEALVFAFSIWRGREDLVRLVALAAGGSVWPPYSPAIVPGTGRPKERRTASLATP